MDGAVKNMLFNGKTFGQGMGEIATGILQDFVNLGLQLVENWAETELANLLISDQAQAAKVGSGVASAAALAGANGVASFALAPWPIDTGAPAFGAAMATAASAFGAAGAIGQAAKFETGAWNIPATGPAILHQGEMVVPQTFAQSLRQNNGGGFGGGGHTINVTLNGRYQNPQEDGRQIAKIIAQQLRLNNKDLRGAMRTS